MSHVTKCDGTEHTMQRTHRPVQHGRIMVKDVLELREELGITKALVNDVLELLTDHLTGPRWMDEDDPRRRAIVQSIVNDISGVPGHRAHKRSAGACSDVQQAAATVVVCFLFGMSCQMGHLCAHLT